MSPHDTSEALSALSAKSSAAPFSKSQRLLKPDQFKAIFSNAPFRASNSLCLILARPNNLKVGRLGLVIAKKHIRLAVQRNRIKRLIRETFRQQQRHLEGIDAIVLARKGLDNCDNAEIVSMLNQQWKRIQKKAASPRPQSKKPTDKEKQKAP